MAHDRVTVHYPPGEPSMDAWVNQLQREVAAAAELMTVPQRFIIGDIHTKTDRFWLDKPVGNIGGLGIELGPVIYDEAQHFAKTGELYPITHQEAPMNQPKPIDTDNFGSGRSVRADSLARKHVGSLIEFTDKDGVTISDVVSEIVLTKATADVFVRVEHVEPATARLYGNGGYGMVDNLQHVSFVLEPDAYVWVRPAKAPKKAKA